MRILKRALPTSLIVGILSVLAFAVPAQADTGTCTVSGVATTNSTSGGFNGVHISANTGNYTFSDTASTTGLKLECLVVDAGVAADASEGTVDVSSQGSYSNSVCGTGSATNTGANTLNSALDRTTLSTEVNTDANKVNWTNTKYSISFVGGQGTFDWTSAAGSGGITGLGGAHDGAISIGADFNSTDGGAKGSANAQNNECTVNFEVNGVLTGKLV
jgi:hypothetical protein